jgi:hypothetical protein
MLPSLKPDDDQPASLAATGTDGKPMNNILPLHYPYALDGSVGNEMIASDSGGPILSTVAMDLSLENQASDGPGRLEMAAEISEAPPGFEPGMKVLQTVAA